MYLTLVLTHLQKKPMISESDSEDATPMVRCVCVCMCMYVCAHVHFVGGAREGKGGVNNIEIVLCP